MKWNHRSWIRSDLESYAIFLGSLFFTFVLTAYFVKHLNVFMTEPRIASVIAGLLIGGMSASSILGFIGVRRFGGYYSRSFQLGPHRLLVCITHRLSEAGIEHEVDVKKAPWYFFIKPIHVICLPPSKLNIEIFNFSGPSSSLYIGPKTEANEEVMKEMMDVLNPLGSTYIAHKILSSYGDKPT